MTRFALCVPPALALLGALAAPARAEGTVYAVLVADTNGADIGKAVQKDCETVEALLAGGIGRQHLRVSHLRGGDVTPARLVTGLITERGRCEASEAGLAALYPEKT